MEKDCALRPATKFLNATPTEQWEHVISEFQEATIELIDLIDNGNKDALQRAAEEIVDLQMSCETMLAILGLNADQRAEVRRKVVEKNRVRGYYSSESRDLAYWKQQADMMSAKYHKPHSVIRTYYGDYSIFPASVKVGAACKVIYTTGEVSAS